MRIPSSMSSQVRPPLDLSRRHLRFNRTRSEHTRPPSHGMAGHPSRLSNSPTLEPRGETLMESVIRAAVVYIVLLVLFRLAGKRSLAEVTTFDLVLLLIISEATQQAMIDNDNSMTNALLLVTTLVGLNILFSFIAKGSKGFEKLIEDVPLVIVEDGKPLKERMQKERVNEDEVMEAARELEGLERLEQIKYAILERNGHIT